MHEPQISGESSSKRHERGTKNVAQASRISLLHQRCFDQQNRPQKYRTWISMKEIIELLGVGEASVRRCFRVMRSDLNMPIEYVAEKKGFGYTQKVTSFPLMTMNESEIGAMIVAQQMLALCEGRIDLP